METLILTRKEISRLLNMETAIGAAEEAYRIYGQEKLVQPPIISIDIPEHNGELDIKSCYSMTDDIISIKNASGYWSNTKDYNLPNLIASIILLDGKTGYPLCIMDGSMITGYRTGAAGGLSAKILGRKDSKTVGVIGAGNQARMQIRAIKEVLDIKTVKVWSHLNDGMDAYKRDIEQELDIQVEICETAESAVRNVDIIVTATPGRKAIVQDDWIKAGTHIIAVGADNKGKQELDTKIFRRARVFVDSKEQCLEIGETRNPIISGDITPDSIDAEISEVILNIKDGRTSKEEITIFDTTGMGIQDNTLAFKLYKNAIESGMGTKINLLSN